MVVTTPVAMEGTAEATQEEALVQVTAAGRAVAAELQAVEVVVAAEAEDVAVEGAVRK